MITIYLLILLAWSGCCVVAGQIWKVKRQLREDYNQRDAWADHTMTAQEN